MRKTFFLFSITFIFLVFPSYLDKAVKVEKIEDNIIIEEEEIYTLLFAGDVMLDRGVKHMVKKHGEDYTFPFLNIKETLEKADLLFCNLESMISDKGRNVGSIYSFRAPVEALEGLLFAGFDIVTLANNHTFDYTREAFEDTMRRLKEANIAYTGAGFNKEKAHSPAVVTLGEDMKIGFLGYTEFLFPSAYATEERSGITSFSEEKMKEDIESAKEIVDFLVVTFHFGDEYQKTPNKKQESWSKLAVDYGADLIIGHHPHVTQPVENYNGKYIAYSLGNFIFDQYFSEETMSGFLLEIKIKEKEVIEAKKIHYKLNEFYQPEVTEEEII
jgi:poly-gamma-glutamate capsule biosynthesis protein CapA/YwtB (metallophosphatase superfamily)